MFIVFFVSLLFVMAAEGRPEAHNVHLADSVGTAANTGLLNTAVVVGNSVTFTCYYDNAATVPDWLHFSPLNHSWTNVRLTDIFIGRFELRVDEQRKRSELLISVVRPSDAGRYACWRVVDGISTYYTVDLTVIATNPTCLVNSSDNGHYQVEEGSEFQVHCNVDYTGNWVPTIQCELPFKQDNVSSLRIASNSVSLTQRITALRSISGTAISCTTSFNKDGLHFVNISQTNSTQEQADNVPSYSFTWLSPSLVVLYGVQSVSITSPSKSEVNGRRSLRCSASSNPRAEYQWTNLMDDSITQGSQYELDICDRPSVNRLVLRCLARNVVNGQEYSATEDVTVEKTRICKVSAISRRPSFFKSLSTYLGTVLSIWTTAAIIVIIMKRSAQNRHRARTDLRNEEEMNMMKHDPTNDTNVCSELLLKSPTNLTTKSAD